VATSAPENGLDPGLYFLPAWPPEVGPLFQVALLLAFAALAGEAARRWLRVPRILGYITLGAALGPHALGAIDAHTVASFQPLVDIAVGLLLFELGQRVDLGWLRRNPWLLATSLLEAGLAFAAVYALLVFSDTPPIVAATIAVFAIATSPAVVITVVKELQGQGQVTERALLFTAMNAAYAVVGLSVLFGWLHLRRETESAVMLAHPVYLVGGSVLLAIFVAGATLLLLRLFGRNSAFQFTLIIAIVLLAVALSAALRLSVPLTLLLAGLFARTLDRQRHFAALQFGEGAMVFTVILFAYAGASLELSGWRTALVPALGFIAARFVGKAVPLFLLARPSALPVRQASLVNLALMPMSGLALLMLGDLTALFPEIAGDVAATVLLATTILTFVGPLATEFALRRAGDAREASGT
jgi:Kef-type K+ transport system membrane component KefB